MLSNDESCILDTSNRKEVITLSTGPQKYPGAVASGASWYQDNYGGDKQEVNVIVLHTTEGTNLDGYQGGAVAPNFTAVPDFANKKLKWYQHFDFDTSSRALVNLAGGVETNTNNVCQVELVGTCDPTTHKKWAKYQHIYWPEAPEWALDELAKFLAWANKNHNVPLVGPAKWAPYPSSYANGAGQRMTGTQWNAFKGICGHQHVPENVHGDPGALDFKTLVAKAKALVTPVTPTKPTTPAKQTVTLANLKYGKTNADVKKVQLALIARGFKIPNGATSGYWDQTKAAYKKFQQSLGYTGNDADGIPGPTSLKKLGFNVK